MIDGMEPDITFEQAFEMVHHRRATAPEMQHFLKRCLMVLDEIALAAGTYDPIAELAQEDSMPLPPQNEPQVIETQAVWLALQDNLDPRNTVAANEIRDRILGLCVNGKLLVTERQFSDLHKLHRERSFLDGIATPSDRWEDNVEIVVVKEGTHRPTDIGGDQLAVYMGTDKIFVLTRADWKALFDFPIPRGTPGPADPSPYTIDGYSPAARPPTGNEFAFEPCHPYCCAPGRAACTVTPECPGRPQPSIIPGAKHVPAGDVTFDGDEPPSTADRLRRIMRAITRRKDLF